MTCNKPIIFDIEALDMIPERKKDANKGTYKKVLIIAGSEGMSGAAYLSALAAYRTGAGLVYIMTVEENRQILQILLPEAIVLSYSKSDVNSDTVINEKLEKYLTGKDIIVLGPGMGTDSCSSQVVRKVLKKSKVPMIIDADALNIIAQDDKLREYFSSDTVITPHPGEMSRLTGISIKQISENRIKTAADYSEKNGVTCVLKGHETVTVTNEGRTYINKSGSPALAKGGSGDVLTGVIAGLMCLGLPATLAAPLGVFVHGLAGEYAAEKSGEHSILARDITDYIFVAMKNDRT